VAMLKLHGIYCTLGCIKN